MSLERTTDLCPGDDCPSNDYMKLVVDAAREQWCSDDLEIDDELTAKDFSQGDEGTWVHAWVWVRHDSLPSPDEEGIEDE